MIEHYDGSRWRWVSSGITPTLPLSELTPASLQYVTCLSSRDCWAFGYGGHDGSAIVDRWNGNVWTEGAQEPDTVYGLQGGECVSRRFCLALDSDDDSRVFAWNGTTWSSQQVPKPAGTGAEPSRISCTSTAQCWIVGVAISSRNPVALLDSWNGRSWSLSPESYVFGTVDQPSAISCITATNCWVAGSQLVNDRGRTFLAHLVGSQWIVAQAPSDPGVLTGWGSYLGAIDCVDASHLLGHWRMAHRRQSAEEPHRGMERL